MADRLALATEERRDLADLLDSLTADQWLHPSLCEGWSVRDVVAHVVSYEELGYGGLAFAFLRGGFRPARVNRIRLDAYRDHPPDQLVGLLRSHLTPRGLTAGQGGAIGLADCLIHHQDIRRPLGLPRDVPPERLVEVLQITLKAPTLPTRRNARGLRLVATDLDWHHGAGAEVTAPGEALVMALAGRPAALHELHGPGRETLSQRLANSVGSAHDHSGR
jgi:uncharacterized protein (TIGR03083 family)